MLNVQVFLRERLGVEEIDAHTDPKCLLLYYRWSLDVEAFAERVNGAAATGDGVLLRRGHLGECLVAAVGDENAVVAEAVVAAFSGDELAVNGAGVYPHAFGVCVAKRCGVITRDGPMGNCGETSARHESQEGQRDASNARCSGQGLGTLPRVAAS